jgi:hypothetical protein
MKAPASCVKWLIQASSNEVAASGDSHPGSGLRKITRSLILDFATFTVNGQVAVALAQITGSGAIYGELLPAVTAVGQRAVLCW